MAVYLKIENLKEHRVNTGIGVRAFAQQINISSRTVQMIEKNESVNVSKLRAYLEGLNSLTDKDYKLIIERKKTAHKE